MPAAARRLATVPTRPKIIAPYERVSAVMGRDDEVFRSPDLQRKANLAQIAAHPNAVVFRDAVDHPEKYRDIDRTGRDFNRQGIQRLLELKRRGEIDGIAVLDVSRVGRSTADTLTVIEEFRAQGGVFLSSKEHIDDSSTGDLMLTIFAGMAQNMSDRIAEGWRATITARAEDGLHNGPAPVGYRREVGPDGRAVIVIDPVSGPVIAEVFRRYDMGESATSIERELRGRGVIGPKSQGILKRRILANPFYVGDVRLHAYDGRAKKRVRRADAEPFRTRGQHPPLLVTEDGAPDVALFDRVQARLLAQKRLPPRYVDPVHALGGLVRCADCGYSATFFKATATSRKDHYRCKHGRDHGPVPCDGCGSASVVEVEAEVLAQVRALAGLFLVGDPAVRAEDMKRGAAVADREQIERALVKAQDKILRVDDDFYSDRITRDRRDRLVARFEQEANDLQASLDALAPLVEGPTPDEFVTAVERLDERWPTSTPAERNAMLRAAGVVRVEIRRSDRYREPVADRVHVTFSI